MVQPATSDKASQVKLLSIMRWTDRLLTFRTTRPAGYRFTPGHFARLGLPVHGEMVWRAFSIASAPTEDALEYFAMVVPDGLFTSALDRLQPGDSIWIERLSYGFMTADRFADGEDLWMLATGTGLGPYLSILQDPATWQQFRHLVLVHCVRHAAELAYQERLRAWQTEASKRQLPAQLHLVQATTREPGPLPPDRLQGRITSLLRDGLLERQVGLSIHIATSRLMVCGNPDMIAEVRDILRQRGLLPCRRNAAGQFITEGYW